MRREMFSELTAAILAGGTPNPRAACLLSRRATSHIEDRFEADSMHESLAAALTLAGDEDGDPTLAAASRLRAIGLAGMLAAA